MSGVNQFFVERQLIIIITVLSFNIESPIMHSHSQALLMSSTGRAATPQMISRKKNQAPSVCGYALLTSIIAAFHLYVEPILAT